MDVMRVAPRVVRSEDEGVRNVADGVVDSLVVRERAVASIMADAEDGAACQALEPPVSCPQGPLDGEDSPWVQASASEGLDEGVDLLAELELWKYIMSGLTLGRAHKCGRK